LIGNIYANICIYKFDRVLAAMSVITILSALISGALVGARLGLFGGGGSVLATPLLLYVVGVKDPHLAIGTSAAAVAVNAALNAAPDVADHSPQRRLQRPRPRRPGGRRRRRKVDERA